MFDFFMDRGGNFPAMDLLESADSYKLFADMPQVKKEDIKINTEEGNLLCISGKRISNYSNEDQHDIVFNERLFGSFKKCLRLREPINVDGVSAQFQDNVLSVTIPKVQSTKSKSFIDIN
ncbi:HSP20 family protein [Angomonas deanei]|uniref:Hsp20/alpha crystallin family/HSP20-like domain found in ArsA, putative n=1 Tax=Angomonas deanei TaxID=59799 RepID=S9WUB5_9TRYP|eukprot:EPY43046.1 HSP20 family protein [Angomonas deanei]